MIDLFFPPSPQTFRKGRIVNQLTPAAELPEKKRRKGPDPEKRKARQARYRARMRADPVRHERHNQQCRDWHAANKEYSLEQSRAWKRKNKAAHV